VKWIPLFLAVLALPIQTAVADPGAAALEYLGKVREKKVKITPDTAISPETAADKSKELSARIERMAKELAEGSLELGEIREEGDVCGVMVRKIGGFDPGSMQVFALAMVLRSGKWLPAPVPASFENTGLRHDPARQQKLAALEQWMLRQRVLELQKIRSESTSRMRRQIEASLPRKTLEEMQPREVGKGFVEACARQDLSAMLGYLGGLNENLPQDWALRMKAATKAAAEGRSAAYPWRLLTGPEVFRLPLHTEAIDDQGTVSFACLDPLEKSSGFRILHLQVMKSEEGLWQIDLHPAFLDPDEELPEEEELDAELLESLPEKIHKLTPLAPAGTLETAVTSLLDRLKGTSAANVFPLVGGDTEEPWKHLEKAAQMWGLLHDPTTISHPLLLDARQEGSEGAAVVQIFSTRDPERTDLRVLHFQKNDQGWLWNPAPTPTPEPGSDAGKLAKWVEAGRAAWNGKWQVQLMADSSEIKTLPENHPAPPEEARQVVQQWISATQEGNIGKALSLTAWIGDAKGASRMLRNLGHEMSAARKTKAQVEVMGIYQSASWSAVGIKSVTGEARPSFALYPIVQTGKGARILLEIDLFATSSRGREFLNKASLERLQSISTPALSDELAKLLEDYKKATAP